MSNDGAIIINPQADAKTPMVKIVRGFKFKLNLGNYQNADFEISMEQACAREEADQVSTDMYDWCYAQVMESVRDVQAKQARKQASMEQRKPVPVRSANGRDVGFGSPGDSGGY